ncbi:hypothetical protein PG996_011369 [Apiospora saccharicola]|uniref:2EXR domain-containing protein n=1 Tax=Apiospora saccharicola TaxID=335842 RepID=A0ABR1UEV3_9PEZI
MAFHPFLRLPFELQDMVWDYALDNEFKERLVFVHRRTLRVMPTRKNICSIYYAHPRARARALRHYDVEIPVYKLPEITQQDIEHIWRFDEWIVQTAGVRYGEYADTEKYGDRTPRERYWYQYAAYELGLVAEKLIRRFRAGQHRKHSRMLLSTERDRLVLSYDVTHSELVEDYANEDDLSSNVLSALRYDPNPDLLTYQTIIA